jgi:pyridoxine 5-phosphate synthase
MVRLSVNINKIATLRNSRGGNTPNVLQAAINAERFGAQGITVHPRPDERHIRYSDVREIPAHIHVEFNVEGYPSHNFMELVKEVKPAQVTLVPDAHDAITSNAGWDTVKNEHFLKEIVHEMRNAGIRTSIFVDPILTFVEHAKKSGADRIELYTEPYATKFPQNKEAAIKPYIQAAKLAEELELGINAGHDLNLDNLKYFANNITGLLEVSIGHALIAEAIYLGLENTIQMYLEKLK